MHSWALPYKKFTNDSLGIDGKKLINQYPLDDIQKDAIALLLFGSAYSDNQEENETQKVSETLARCEIGGYLGKPEELTIFIKQRYIWVSQITKGAKSNSMGQLAQKFVAEYLKDNLGLSNVKIQSGGRIPGVTHTDTETGRLTSFDFVVTNISKYVAIEISFQVTTNSVIERKSGQARTRYEQIEQAGHKIAYGP